MKIKVTHVKTVDVDDYMVENAEEQWYITYGEEYKGTVNDLVKWYYGGYDMLHMENEIDNRIHKPNYIDNGDIEFIYD